eukprot:GFUD01005415.1.p1 GENE.GFUD01005415.1~~GFUD01005415.1.p1  ORF type:complete len:1058 (+),score=348.20 GFUD01005415.1:302-3475(+)
MDNNQGPCETLGGGAVERQISQTNNLKEEAVVKPEQLEKKNLDADDLPPEEEDLVGKVQVNSSEVEGDVNTSSANHETKINGQSNGYVNGVSGDDSEAEIDGSDSEIEYKETGLDKLADTPNDNTGETESDENLTAGVSIGVVSDTNETESEETMGPNNEAADDVSYDIDLDKSVPELVTEYELLSQGTTVISQSVVQTESAFSSSTSSSSSSVKVSRIPVALDKKSSVFNRQNTYTVESSISGEEIFSSESAKKISMTDVEKIEDEVDASIGSLLQRHNTYTVKSSTVQESQKVSKEFRSFSVEKNASRIPVANLHLSFQEAETEMVDDLETAEDISDASIDKPSTEELNVPKVVPEKLAVLETASNLNEEMASDVEAIAETLIAVEQSDVHVPIVEQKLSETEIIIQKLGGLDITEPSEQLDKESEDDLELILKETVDDLETAEEFSDVSVNKPNTEELNVPEVLPEKLAVLETEPSEQLDKESEVSLELDKDIETKEEIFEESVSEAKAEDVTLAVSENLSVLEIASNSNEEMPSNTETTADILTAVEQSDTHIPIIEEKLSESEIIIQKLEAHNIKEPSEQLDKESEVSLEIDNDMETKDEIFEETVGEAKGEELHVPEVVSEKETIAEAVTAAEQSDAHVPIVKNNFSEREIIIQRLGEQNITEPSEQMDKESEVSLELDNDVETKEEILEGSVGEAKSEEVHVPEVISESITVLDTSPNLSEEMLQQVYEIPAEKENVVGTLTEENSDAQVPIVEEPISEIIAKKPEAQNITESPEPLYKEPEDALEPSDTQYKPAANEVSVAKLEDQYVTAEEVRIQKHKVVVKDEIFPEETDVTQSIPEIPPSFAVENQNNGGEPTIMEETSLLSSHIPIIVPLVSIPVCSRNTEDEETDHDKNFENDNIRTSKDVEQLLRDIRDPNLDCSLEDIEAMIDGKELVPPKEELNRISPEFATAVTLIDQNPDKGFDPEDPAVKGIEDWECSNLNTSLESVESRSSKLKNVFKRRRSRSEERKSLLNENDTTNNNEEEDEDEKVSMGCINSWLLYIFIKIFD